MAAFKYNAFSGLYPKISESLLPPTAATESSNCDFAYGELRNTKGGYLVQTLSNAPASLYTDDGLKFYSWTDEVSAARSPLSRDTFDRLYYTTPNDFRVTSRSGMQVSGGNPASSYRVGVPRPITAPALTVPAIPSLENATIAAKFHYEYGGVKYQEQDIAPVALDANTKWRFDPPGKATGAATSSQAFAATAYYIAGQEAEFWGALDAGTTVSPLSNASVRIVSGGANGFGMELKVGDTLATTMVKDAVGVIHEVETLLTLSQYGLLKASGSSTAASYTPEQAIPVIRLTATDNATHETLFDIYTANSSLGTNAIWQLTITKEDAPATGYAIALSSGAAEADKETRAYVYTYVNTYDEEGPPSPAGSITTATVLPVALDVKRDVSGADYAPIKEIRFYRTPTGSEIADYFYVGALPVLTLLGTDFSFTDDVKASGLNEPISSTEAYAPDPALTGLLALPNGILMAWKGNELHFSEAYRPWAWPPAYVKTFTHNIIGAIAHGSGALVTTIGQPFLISGVSPDSMTDRALAFPQAGVSQWSMADINGQVVYASHDGIVSVAGGQPSMASEPFFTREVWRARCNNAMSSLRFAVWDGRLIVYSSSNAFTAFMLRLDEVQGGAMTDLPDFSAQCSFVSPVTDLCYYASGTGLYQFAGGSDATANWVSRENVLPKPVNFGFAQTVCTGNWTVQFYADGELKHTQAVTGKMDFRLPSGFKSDRWKIGLSGTGRFRELRVAESGREMAGA
ncbi:hypothetical protein [Herminiimonas sp. CN]|uniref:hypothetical protein n=1 Tax=Herminiimonas sp. CN TaxID=1349818 RepID=UPI000473BE66|nr:hypothetical protein [Herminiimonas sp. CN]